MKHVYKERVNQEFKIRFDDKGRMHFEQLDGTPVSNLEWDIWQQLNERYEAKAYLYIGKGYFGYEGLWKIGVSQDFVRRQSEVYAHMQYQVECAKPRVWKIERYFLKRYGQYRETGEYFRLPDEVVEEITKLFTEFESEADLLAWLREEDYPAYAKIWSRR